MIRSSLGSGITETGIKKIILKAMFFRIIAECLNFERLLEAFYRLLCEMEDEVVMIKTFT